MKKVNEARKEMFDRRRNIEFCDFFEEVEVFLVVGNVTEEQARDAIHDLEKFEHGMDEDELFSYPLKQVKVIETEETDEWGYTLVHYNWSEKNKTGRKGWLGSI